MRELSEQEIVRREKLQNIKHPYPERFEVNYELCDAKELEDGVRGVRVAGRIILMRKMGKMSFLTIGDIKGKIQISVKLDMVGEEAYQDFKANYDIGDFIGVEGETFTTHTGEKTIRASSITFLGKALKPAEPIIGLTFPPDNILITLAAIIPIVVLNINDNKPNANIITVFNVIK